MIISVDSLGSMVRVKSFVFVGHCITNPEVLITDRAILVVLFKAS